MIGDPETSSVVLVEVRAHSPDKRIGDGAAALDLADHAVILDPGADPPPDSSVAERVRDHLVYGEHQPVGALVIQALRDRVLGHEPACRLEVVGRIE